METKYRTFFYRRVSWNGNHLQDLESHLKLAHEELQTTADRTFEYNEGGEIQGISYEVRDSGLFCHVTAYVPFRSTLLVPFASSDKVKTTKPQQPPDNHHFMDGDAFFLIKGNHIILCPSNVRETVVITYIKEILKKTNREDLLLKFSIQPITNLNTLKLIKDEGVKRLELNASLYEASVKYMERTSVNNRMFKGISEVLGLLKKDEDKDIDDRENLTVKLSISYDLRKKGGDISKQRLQEIANEVIEEDADKGFVIITRQGKKVTSDQIRISEKFKIPVDGNSVIKEAVWNELEAYLKKLRKSGVLGQ